MNRKIVVVFGVVLSAAPAAASTETFQSYVCADGAQFVAAIYAYDSRHVHLQIDGRAVSLTRRVALSGTRYTGSGITLKISKTGASIKRGKRPASACNTQ